MNACREWFYRGSGYLAGFCIVAIVLIILAQIVGRLFGFIVPSAEDFSGYGLAAATFFGLAYTFREGSHIRVSLLIQRLSPAGRRVQELLVLILALLLAGYMAYYCLYMVWESWEFEELSYGYIAIPLWIPQVPVALGCLAFNIAILDSLVECLRGYTPNYQLHEGEVNLEEA